MLVSFAEGNSVKPVFGFSYYFLSRVTPFLGALEFFTGGPIGFFFAGYI